MNFTGDHGERNNVSNSMGASIFELVVTKNVVVVMLCISINYINSVLVHTFLRHEMFRENPRYILFIHLICNDMIQLTAAALLHVLAYVFFRINYLFCCFILMTVIFTTFNTPLNLAGMAIERYIAVCYPMRHHQICSVNRTYIFISLIWAMAASTILPDVFVLLVTHSNQLFHSSIYCIRENVFRYAFMKAKENIFDALCLTTVCLILVFTYSKVLFAAKALKAEAKKARNTILLHAVQLFLCMLTYISPPLHNMLMHTAPITAREVRFTIYLIIYILPRSLSPIFYGLRDKSFQKYFKRYFLCNITMTVVKHIANPRVSFISDSRAVTPHFDI